MQDIIEGDSVSSWQLFRVALHASAMLMIVALTPKPEICDELF